MNRQSLQITVTESNAEQGGEFRLGKLNPQLLDGLKFALDAIITARPSQDLSISILSKTANGLNLRSLIHLKRAVKRFTVTRRPTGWWNGTTPSGQFSISRRVEARRAADIFERGGKTGSAALGYQGIKHHR